MASLHEIVENPSEYLGAEANEGDAAVFGAAVQALMHDQGLSEREAIERVWNNGDWWPQANMILDGQAADRLERNMPEFGAN